MQYALLTAGLLVTVIAVSGCTSLQHTGQKESNSMENQQAVFETTMGSFTVELYEQRAPETTENFITLTEEGFYDGTKFHRVISDFMVQGGDPLSKDEDNKHVWGTGGPGYEIDDEIHPELKHDAPGVLSMANSGPDTGGSQFFITVASTPWIDGKHAVFGKVVDGYAVVEQISTVDTDAHDRPRDDVIVESIDITR